MYISEVMVIYHRQMTYSVLHAKRMNSLVINTTTSVCNLNQRVYTIRAMTYVAIMNTYVDSPQVRRLIELICLSIVETHILLDPQKDTGLKLSSI